MHHLLFFNPCPLLFHHSFLSLFSSEPYPIPTAAFLSVTFFPAQPAWLDPWHLQRKEKQFARNDATFLNGLCNCDASVAAEKTCEKLDGSPYSRRRNVVRTYSPPAASELSLTFKAMRKWIWVMIGLSGAVFLQERFHKLLAAAGKERKWGQLRGDNEHCLCMCDMSVCACMTG